MVRSQSLAIYFKDIISSPPPNVVSLALPYRVERCFDQRQYISLTYPRFALDSIVISLGASHWTGFVCCAKSIPQLFHVSTGRPGYKYDNTRGASGSERNNPFRSAPSPLDRVPCSTMLSVALVERNLSLSTVMYYSSSSFAALRYWKSENAN